MMTHNVRPETPHAAPPVDGTSQGHRLGIRLMLFTIAVFLLITAPVVVQGGLLSDDYVICLRLIQDGYESYFRHIWAEFGMVRPARVIELLLISSTCTSMPFGVAMLVPLGLKLAATVLLFGLLRDMRVPDPWPTLGATLWLLEPVGTEAALWPAALHVPLGLVLALAALRLYRRKSWGLAVMASLGAALSVEQVIFALPVAVWLTVPREDRFRAAAMAAGAMGAVILAYAIWPGENVRQAMTLSERWQQVLAKREWYLYFPVANVGLYSGALAFVWALPYSVALVLVGAVAGAWLMPRLLAGHRGVPPDRGTLAITVAAVAAMFVAINLPLMLTEVGYSARTFTPTWLALCGVIATSAACVPWRRPRVLGALAGTFAVFAILSLALSASVRVRTDAFNRTAAQWIADRTEDGDVVAVCDVDRTVVNPAPLGSFHLHQFHSSRGAWIEFHTGRRLEIRRSGERYWGSRCPDLTGADLVIRFPDLMAELVPGERR